MCFTTTSKPTFTHLTPVYLSMKCQESGTLTSWYGKDCSILQILAYQLYVVPSFSAQPGKSVDMYTIMFLNMLIVLITRCEKEANDFVCGCSILSIWSLLTILCTVQQHCQGVNYIQSPWKMSLLTVIYIRQVAIFQSCWWLCTIYDLKESSVMEKVHAQSGYHSFTYLCYSQLRFQASCTSNAW